MSSGAHWMGSLCPNDSAYVTWPRLPRPSTATTPPQAPGTVATVVQKGYLLNGRVLRPARVLIARQPI